MNSSMFERIKRCYMWSRREDAAWAGFYIIRCTEKRKWYRDMRAFKRKDEWHIGRKLMKLP